jgi:peroxiredoxin
MILRPPLFLTLLTFLVGASRLHADWAQVTALDLPTIRLSPNPLKAKIALKERFETQIAANETFLKTSPNDPHVYESKVRLAVAQARLGSLEQDPRVVDAALARLITLEKQAPDTTQRAEAMFRRISLQWQNLGNDPDQRRERALTSAKVFAAEFPQDRRAARLLAEAASLCDNHPEEKQPLVEQALTLSQDEALTQRLQDDIKRLNQLGHPVALTFTATNGSLVDLSKYRGQVVALLFWAAESAPSLVWLKDFTTYTSGVTGLKVVGVSLDQDQADLDSAIKAMQITWPIAFDGKGWKNSIARQFGINALPTLWLIDKEGCLQSLNARDNYQFTINELLLRH